LNLQLNYDLRKAELEAVDGLRDIKPLKAARAG